MKKEKKENRNFHTNISFGFLFSDSNSLPPNSLAFLFNYFKFWHLHDTLNRVFALNWLNNKSYFSHIKLEITSYHCWMGILFSGHA